MSSPGRLQSSIAARQSSIDLQTPVKFIKGVGPKRADDLAFKNILTVEDLLYNLPYRYEDRTHFKTVKELKPGEYASILVKVLTAGLMITRKSRMRIFDLAARDESGVVRCKWFHSDYLAQRKVFKSGQTVIFYGKFEVDPYGTGNLQVINPEFEILEEAYSGDSLEMGRIVPVYESVKGCSARVLRRIVHSVLDQLKGVVDALPAEIVSRRGLLARQAALREAHFPSAATSMETLAHFRTPALQRLVFEELFFLEVGMALKRRKARTFPGLQFQTSPGIREAIKSILPFHPTRAQKRVLKEIVDDLCRPVPMNRLLQGDVGCGKTIVALEASAVAMENGYQSALLVPTEILAEQHYFNTRRIYARNAYSVALLKSGLKRTERAEVLSQLAEGKVQMVIGTHALLEPDVNFKNLGLVLIDEQHRFGVMQRFHLMKKGTTPHTLVMTATPIPRTLAMTIYGDLEVSIIDELPPNRSPIVTRVVSEAERSSAYRFLREQVKLGRQAYVVCPLVEESEKVDLRAVAKTFEHLSRDVFPDLRVDCLHGRMKSSEKEECMRRFIAGQAQVLVSTTVIEVGVDVPNATLMLVEHAERFGLAQLHQLRGRIGRGTAKSYCLLMQAKKGSDEAEQRLKCMVETTDGFRIAERDLELRGPGEFFGTKQSGLPSLRVANLLRDADILETARSEAMHYVEHPPSQEEFRSFLACLKTSWQRRYGLVAVG
jgi:ATP-dependent DNA helicase RecG